jgi:hypothetical protein
VSYFVVLDKVFGLRSPYFTLAALTFVCSQATVSVSNTVALDFGRALFGPIGGTVFACMIAVSCFGALNGRCSPPFVLFITLMKGKLS